VGPVSKHAGLGVHLRVILLFCACANGRRTNRTCAEQNCVCHDALERGAGGQPGAHPTIRCCARATLPHLLVSPLCPCAPARVWAGRCPGSNPGVFRTRNRPFAQASLSTMQPFPEFCPLHACSTAMRHGPVMPRSTPQTIKATNAKLTSTWFLVLSGRASKEKTLRLCGKF
jgi:hypothetical protein